MTILAIVQANIFLTVAREVMLPLGSKPMIIYQMERIRLCRRLDRLVLATSDDRSDDTLSHVVSAAGFPVFVET